MGLSAYVSGFCRRRACPMIRPNKFPMDDDPYRDHYLPVQEFARCRRLNSTLLTALGTRSCDALERASYGGGFGSEHQFGTGAGSTNSGGGGFDEVGPYRSVYTTSGPFRPAPATHTPDLTTPVSPLAGGQGGVGATKGVEEEGVVSLTAVQVKRGLRFCMKVHRFREMCRHGSCVAVWKVSLDEGEGYAKRIRILSFFLVWRREMPPHHPSRPCRPFTRLTSSRLFFSWRER